MCHSVFRSKKKNKKRRILETGRVCALYPKLRKDCAHLQIKFAKNIVNTTFRVQIKTTYTTSLLLPGTHHSIAGMFAAVKAQWSRKQALDRRWHTFSFLSYPVFLRISFALCSLRKPYKRTNSEPGANKERTKPLFIPFLSTCLPLAAHTSSYRSCPAVIGRKRTQSAMIGHLGHFWPKRT
jgi:hypothetical protein